MSTLQKLLIMLMSLMFLDGSNLIADEKTKPFLGINHTYALLLTGEDMKGIRLAAKSVVKDTHTDQRLIELAARNLFKTRAYYGNITVDTLAWCARVLETHGSERYYDALSQLLKTDIPKKLKKYVLIAKKSVSDRPMKLPTFDPKSKPIKLNLKLPASTNVISGSAQDKVKIGDSIDKVYKVLGNPIDIKVVSRKAGHGWIRVEISNLEASFDGYGTIIFIRNDKQGKGWTVRRILTNRSLSSELLNSEFGQYINEINSNNPENIRRIARQIYNERKYNTEILDHAAERIVSEAATRDKLMQDAKAWLCRIIGESRNSRYYSIIKDIAKHSESSKIRKYATKALKNIEESNINQYQKGAVNQ